MRIQTMVPCAPLVGEKRPIPGSGSTTGFERLFVALHPLLEGDRLRAAGKTHGRLLRSAGPRACMFDCQMCGQCALSSTGMSCPMNCPKNDAQRSVRRRVRANGNCEVKPDMRCVWVEGLAKAASGCVAGREAIQAWCSSRWTAACEGRSSWLKVAREKGQSKAVARLADGEVFE